ncbi:type I site-specific restriction endonuclease [Bradyrhizobium diazoefficiens]
MLNEDKEQAGTLKEGIAEQISTLPLSVSFVKQEEALIRTAQTHHYWAKADENKFDELVARLGPLMKFREQMAGSGPVHLDLTDVLHNKEMVEFGPQHEAVSISRYREMVEVLIAELTEHNLVLKKIKNGEAVKPHRFGNSLRSAEPASVQGRTGLVAGAIAGRDRRKRTN